MKQIFLLFILLNLIMPQIAYAAPPWAEVDSDTELRGAIFANDASNLYAAVCGDNLCISSPVHREGVTLKFKVTALYARMKNYNGLNVGVTHIADDGTITHTIKQLKPDSQGFAYATFDFSTVIISGLTGTTTFSETGLSGNYTKTFNEANVSYIDFNITNHDSAAYIIGGNNYAHRRLLTLNQTAENLTDFQVQKNQTWYTGMQPDMRDNTYTYFGNDTELSYWDESVINNTSKKTWHKIPTTSTIENTLIWMYYGNPNVSSASSGSDVFLHYNDATSLTDWTGSGTSIFGGKLRYLDSTSAAPLAYYAHGETLPNDVITEIKANFTEYLDEDYTVFVVLDGAGTTDRFSQIIMGETFDDYRTTDTTVITSPLVRDEYKIHQMTLRKTDSKVDYSILSLDRSVDGSVADKSYVVGSPSTYSHIGLFSGGSGRYCDIRFDWLIIRKYTATEPSWALDGAEQSPSSNGNITTSVIGNTTTINYTTDIPQTHTLIPTANISQIVFNTTSTDWDYTAVLYWTNDIILTETAINGEYHANVSATVPINLNNGTINYTITNTPLLNADFSTFIQFSTNDTNFNESASNLTLPDISLYTTATTGTYYYDLQYDYFYPPQNLTATPDYTYIALNWNDVSNADQYSVYLDGTLITNVTDSYYTAFGLDAGASYSFDVSAWNNSRQTANTTLATATLSTVPAATMNLSLQDIVIPFYAANDTLYIVPIGRVNNTALVQYPAGNVSYNISYNSSVAYSNNSTGVVRINSSVLISVYHLTTLGIIHFDNSNSVLLQNTEEISDTVSASAIIINSINEVISMLGYIIFIIMMWVFAIIVPVKQSTQLLIAMTTTVMYILTLMDLLPIFHYLIILILSVLLMTMNYVTGMKNAE